MIPWQPAYRRLPVILGLLLLLAGVAGCAGGAAPDGEPAGSRFTDVAAAAGLDFDHGAFHWGLSDDPVAMRGGGLCWLDYDRDGWLDLYVVNSYAQDEAGRWESEAGGLPRNGLFRNRAGQFSDVSAATGSDLTMRGNGCVAADLNRDGWTDLYVTSARENALLWNNGDGTFSEGAAAAGVAADGWQSAAVVGDVNRDGWPDLFVAGYVDLDHPLPNEALRFPNTHLGLRDLLFLSSGAGPAGGVTFREVGALVGLEPEPYEYGLGALLSDVDNDGDLDLFVANDSNPNRLYLNDSYPGGAAADPAGIGLRFTEAGGPANVDDSNSGMGVAGGDFDGDGRVDIFVANLGRQSHSIYLNDSTLFRPLFADAHANPGLAGLGVGWTGWGATWIDYDQDTDLDLIVINGGVPVLDRTAAAQLPHVYANLTAQGHPGRLEAQSVASGMDAVGPLLGRGAAAADYDNDGDMDLAVATIGGQLALLRNESTRDGNWLTVTLGDFAPGALLTAVLPDGRVLEREMHAGSSYLASEDPRCHFGLGSADIVTELRVRWPDGSETRLNDVPANRFLAVRRGS